MVVDVRLIRKQRETCDLMMVGRSVLSTDLLINLTLSEHLY